MLDEIETAKPNPEESSETADTAFFTTKTSIGNPAAYSVYGSTETLDPYYFIRLHDNDVLLIKVGTNRSAAFVETLRRTISDALGNGVKVVVIPEEQLSVQVLRQVSNSLGIAA